MDNAAQRLYLQVKKSLAAASSQQSSSKQQEGSGSGSSETSSCPTPAEGFVLPPLNTAKGADPKKEGSLPPTTIKSGSTNVSPMKTAFPSVLTGSDRETELLGLSPHKKALREGVPKVTDDTRGEAASRRKQNFAEKNDDSMSEPKLVQAPGQQPQKPDDLTLLPVTLTASQRRMFFGPLKPLFSGAKEGKDGLHQCAECGAVCKNLADGHKHMVTLIN
jgi:hypothetical protein